MNFLYNIYTLMKRWYTIHNGNKQYCGIERALRMYLQDKCADEGAAELKFCVNFRGKQQQYGNKDRPGWRYRQLERSDTDL